MALFSHHKEQPDYFPTVNRVIDVIFIIDILVSFNTSFFDQQDNRFTTSRKTIARAYVKSWFCIDLVAVIDFEFLLKILVESNSSFAQLGKVAKVARFYRAIKLLRLIRMSKLVKEKAKLQARMASKM